MFNEIDTANKGIKLDLAVTMAKYGESQREFVSADHYSFDLIASNLLFSAKSLAR